MNENWKDIKGYEGLYQVSNLGRVKSLERYCDDSIGRHRLLKERILKPGLTGNKKHNHKTVCFREDNAPYYYLVHRLVLIAFSGDCPEGMEASHLDGDSLNNNKDNLSWETHKENNDRRIGHGTDQFGERNPRSKFTDAEIIKMREKYSDRRISLKEIGKIYNVNGSCIGDILSRRTWRHV